jgi:hypothetical protein
VKQLFYINTHNPNQALQPVLSVRIGERHCGFAVTDKTGSELYSLAYYTLPETDSGLLADIFSAHPELNSSFYEVQVGYDYPKSLLVPFQYYDIAQAKQLLNTLYGKDGEEAIISEAVNEWQLYNVYAVPKDVQEWVGRRFHSVKYHHNYTVRIKMPAGLPDRLLVDLHTDEFSFVVVKANRLLLAQTNTYSTPEDILYCLLNACEQFQLSQRETELCISGLIEKESQLYRELDFYFLQIGFREPTWNTPGIGENEYPSHFFTTLNDLARCVS